LQIPLKQVMVALTFATLILAIPKVSLAQSQTGISFTPASATPGTSVAFTGSFGFPSSAYSSYSFNCTLSAREPMSSRSASIIANYQFSECTPSSFRGIFRISKSAALGDYIIGATISIASRPSQPTLLPTVYSFSSSADFRISPTITIDPISGPVGATVSVRGTFSSSDAYVVLYGIPQTSTQTCPVSDGVFSCAFVVGNVQPGFYNVIAQDISGNLAVGTFTVTGGGSSYSPNIFDNTLLQELRSQLPVIAIAIVIGLIVIGLILKRRGSKAKTSSLPPSTLKQDEAIVAAANSLGISTAGKTKEEIVKEIQGQTAKTKVCPKCSVRSTTTADFCDNCGERL
jgi:hypothetical protein